MPKTTAKIEHRENIVWGWYAIQFCHVNFYGFRAEEMQKKRKSITHERYLKYHSLYKENERKIQFLRKQADDICKRVKASKPFYRFWYNKKEKEILSEAYNLLNQAHELEEENKLVDNEKFFGPYEYYRKIEELLKENGFSLIQISYSEDECIAKTEIWTLEE